MLHFQRLLVFPLVRDFGGKLSSWKELLYEGYPKYWKGFICFLSWLSGWNHIWFSSSSSPVNRGRSSLYFFFKLYLFYGSLNVQGKHLLPARVNIKNLANSFISMAVLRSCGGKPSMHCSELLIILRLLLEVAKCETLGRPKWGH